MLRDQEGLRQVDDRFPAKGINWFRTRSAWGSVVEGLLDGVRFKDGHRSLDHDPLVHREGIVHGGIGIGPPEAL